MTPLATLDRRVRYAIAGAILLALLALFVQREFSDADEEQGGATADLGLRDDAAATIGAPAPDFALRSVEGEVVRLSEFRGRTVVVNFWASWCVPCRREMTEFEELYRERMEAEDFVVIAVDYRPLDSESEVERFLASFAGRDGHPIEFPVVFDTLDGAVAERYGVAPRNASQATLPVSYFIDRDGVLRAKVLGPVFGGLLPEKVAETEAAAAP
ncbi:MAG: TlpA disulfide reductase family protein [Dehalococcoidia bacterium]